MIGRSFFSRFIEKAFFFLKDQRDPNLHFYFHLGHLISTYQLNTIIDIENDDFSFVPKVRGNLGFQGKVFSFEYRDDFFKQLQGKSVKDFNWTVFPFTLSNVGEKKQDSDKRLFKNMVDPLMYGILAPRVVINGLNEDRALKLLEELNFHHQFLKSLIVKIDFKESFPANALEKGVEKFYRYGFILTGVFPTSFNPDTLEVREFFCCFAKPGITGVTSQLIDES